jgi:hypothetical protein
MSQTTYSTDLSVALPGMLADNGDKDIVAYPSAEDIPPGRQCVLNSEGKLELPQDTSYAKPVGVSCYLSAAPISLYKAGDMVPCVRRGRVWAETTGSAPGQLVEANVNHSSTTATHRGKFTTSAVSASAGSEIADAGPVTFTKAGASGLAIVECNFPGASADDDARLDLLEAVQIQKKSVTIPFDLAAFLASGDDGADVDVNVGTALPAGAMLLGARYTIATPFAGAGVSTLTMIVGFAGDANGVIEAVDIFGDAAGEYRGVPGTAMGGPAGSKQLVANFDPDASAGLDELTAGDLTIDVFYAVG